MNTLVLVILIAALCLVIPGLWSAILTVLMWGLAIGLVLLAIGALLSDWS